MSSGLAAARLISANVMVEALPPDGVSVALTTASSTLATHTSTEIGLWQAEPGWDTDIESDEIFLVLDGAATVQFDDGSVLDLRPGVLVRLLKGDRTTWHVTERLRKLYLA